MSGLPELLHECRFVPEPQVGSRTDAEAVHLFGRHFADAEKAFDGQSGYELLDPLRRDREQSVGFPIVGGDLCQHLVDRDSGRGRQSGFGEDAGFDFAGDQRRRTDVAHVEKRFVERERLHEFGVFAEDGADLSGNGFVDIEPCRNEDQFRTQPLRQHGREGRMNPIGAGFVACRGDDPARSVISDGDRTAPVFGAVALLYGCVKGIHVDMDNLALGHRAFVGRTQR